MSTSPRFCPQCGKPSAPYETTCSNCGRAFSDPSSIPPTQYAGPSSSIPPTQYASPSSSIPPTQYASPSSSYTNPLSSTGQPPIEATQYASPPATDPYGSSPYGSPSFTAADPYGPSSSTASNPYGASPYEAATASSAPPPPILGQTPHPRKGPNVGLIIGAVILILVLAGGGVFFAISRGSTPSQTKGASPTVTTQAAPQALFSDNFADNSKGWRVTHGSADAQKIGNNMLTLTDNMANDFIADGLPTNTLFTDFAVTVTFTMTQGDPGDAVEIGLRSNSDFTHEYGVDFYGNQMFSIYKYYLDTNNNPQSQALLSQSQTALLNPVGQPNTVIVIMKGTKIVVLINKSVVGSASDSDYSNGGIVLSVLTDANSKGATVSFSSVTVNAAPAQLPSQ